MPRFSVGRCGGPTIKAFSAVSAALCSLFIEVFLLFSVRVCPRLYPILIALPAFPFLFRSSSFMKMSVSSRDVLVLPWSKRLQVQSPRSLVLKGHMWKAEFLYRRPHLHSSHFPYSCFCEVLTWQSLCVHGPRAGETGAITELHTLCHPSLQGRRALSSQSRCVSDERTC